MAILEPIKKVYRIFVSSCSRLLTEERKILANLIVKKGHLPRGMEYDFGGANTTLSISIDKEKLQNSDCVIFILSYLYGEIINKKIGGKKDNECPFSSNATDNFPHDNCDSCYAKACHISFTHFEYLFATHIGKPVYVIVNENYDDQKAFEECHEAWKKSGGSDCLTLWGQGRDKNRRFIDSVEQFHRFSYKQKDEFEKTCNDVLNTILHDLEKSEYDSLGLVPCSMQGPDIFKPITFFNQDVRPKETTFFETIKDAKKFYFMARTGVTFLTRYNPTIKQAIDAGCECRFIILNRDSDMIKNGRYETAFDQKNADMSLFYLKKLKEYNPELVKIHITDFYPTFDIEYFEKSNGEKMVVVQSHFLVSHLGPDRPMFMLHESDYWYYIFKDEIDQMWENTAEWSGVV